MFRVEWLQSALDDLAGHWIEADQGLRQALTVASQEIDERLRRDPGNEGESRPSGRRMTFVPPLAVTFRIDVDGQTVTVVEILLYRRPR
jgi:hypothetical protein